MSYASGLMMGTAIVRILGQLISGGASEEMGGMSRGSRGGMGGRGKNPMDLGGFGEALFNMPGMGTAGRKGMGAKASEAPSEMAFPGFSRSQGTVPGNGPVLVSSLPGRRRYRMAGMTGDQADMLKENLCKLHFVKTVEASTVTGSLLLLYDEKEAAALDKIMEKVVSIFTGNAVEIQGEAAFIKRAMAMESHVGLATRTVRSLMRDISRWLQAGTGGWLDASSLASLVFFFQGIKKMMLTQQFPSGSQMLWWAVSLMRGWRTL